MKTKTILIVGILAALYSFIGCNKEDNDSIIYAGNWINERNDTIFFYENDPGTHDSGLLILKKSDLPNSTLYSYRVTKDSLILFPSHSSNLNDWKGYSAQWGTNEFVLFQFNNIEKSTYKRVD